jgi:hypothetical protein
MTRFVLAAAAVLASAGLAFGEPSGVSGDIANNFPHLSSSQGATAPVSVWNTYNQFIGAPRSGYSVVRSVRPQSAEEKLFERANGALN